MYEVGQVLYVLMKKDHTVIPVRVVEKILRKTLDGESISHIVELPTPSQDQIDLDKLGPGVYSSSADAMSVMIENASTTISSIVKKAEHIAQTVFNVKIQDDMSTSHIAEVDTTVITTDNATDTQAQIQLDTGENIEIDLGHGVKGKINMGNLEV
tara:strand:- start:189 stop:653 length:465 start_codon:yes stop_codon:yes gene_type:complete